MFNICITYWNIVIFRFKLLNSKHFLALKAWIGFTATFFYFFILFLTLHASQCTFYKFLASYGLLCTEKCCRIIMLNILYIESVCLTNYFTSIWLKLAVYHSSYCKVELQSCGRIEDPPGLLRLATVPVTKYSFRGTVFFVFCYWVFPKIEHRFWRMIS